MKDVRRWLESLGLDEYVESFSTHRISADILPDLGEQDLEKLGIPLGDRKRLLRAIARLREQRARSTADEAMGLAGDEDAGGEGEPDDPGAGEPIEWRQLTLMFVDLVGSTPLSTRLALEEYCAVIRALHERSIEILRRHNGFMAQFQGDGLLAYFGYPRAGEDDAERAVIAGLAIARAVGGIESEPGASLQARVGIATGLVAVGDLIGRGLTDSRLVTGETANLAARLQTIAEPGTVVVSDVTRNLLGKQFACEDLGRRALKGFREPIPVWRVREVRHATSRFHSHQRGTLTSFVDREEEIDLFHRRWQSARAGQGQTVLVSGEPGIGKSRLADVFSRQIEHEPQSRFQFQCLPNQTGSSFFPVITELERAIGFANGESQPDKLGRLEAWLRPELKSSPDAVRIFAKLLSIPADDRYGPLRLEPREFKNAALGLLFDQFAGLLEKAPAILIFEDLQWIDPTSQEFLDDLIERMAGWRLFLICTCRPEYQPQWIGDASVTYLSLRRLDSRQSTALMANIADGVDLPREIAAEILFKTDGVPLFLEELTKSVLESGSLRREGQAYTLPPDTDALSGLPSTLLGSLLARLDRIAGAQKVAPIGAAIGRTFSYELLRAVVDLDERELRSVLSRLVDAQLLTQHGRLPDATCKFKHALVQDAAYETLPKDRRRDVHRRIAAALAGRSPEHPGTRPELVAYHYDRSDTPAEAVAYWRQAATQALQRSANVEAIAHIRHGLAANEHTADAKTRVSNEIQLREMLLVPLEVTNWGAKENADNLEVLRTLRQARGDTEELLSVLHGICSDHIIGGRVARAREFAGKILQISNAREGRTASVLGNRCMGFCDFLAADFRGSIAHFQKTIELCAEVDRDEIKKYYYADIELIPRAMIAWALVLAGRKAAAEKAIALAARETEEESDMHSKAYALCVLASAHQSAADPATSLSCSSRALSLSQKHGFRYWEAWAQILKGWALAANGGHNQGIGELKDGIAKYVRTGSRQMLPYARILLADANCRAGHFDEAAGIIDEVKNTQEFNEIRYVDLMAAQIRKRLLASAL